MAQSTGELAQAAEHAHVDLYFEAAVAGAIPVIRPLTQSLAGDTVLRVAGIVNGTTNYILSEMDSTGADYADGAGRRQRAGLRRGRPDRRRRGLRRRRQGRHPGLHRLPHPGDRRRRVPRGHHQGDPGRLRVARALGCTIKLLAICERLTTDEGQQRVSARGLPGAGAADPSAGRGQRRVQRGRGGGRGRRAADVLRPGRRRSADGVGGDGRPGDGGAQPGAGRRGPRESKYAKLPISPIGFIPTRYYVSMNVADRPGVLSAVAAEFGKREVSIAEVRQEGMVDEGGSGAARASSWSRTRPPTPRCRTPSRALADLDVVQDVDSVLRLEGTSE